jgi:hypothetical protein
MPEEDERRPAVQCAGVAGQPPFSTATIAMFFSGAATASMKGESRNSGGKSTPEDSEFWHFRSTPGVEKRPRSANS